MTQATNHPTAVTDLITAIEPERGVWIGGAGAAGSTSATFAVSDPATTDELARISDGTPDDARRAVDAAAAALPAWAARSSS
jgi:succinate-semialdehyde dehydrogenase/glutarate-semialdehyde dehydrogenase